MMESKIEHHRLKMMFQTIVAKIGNDTNLQQEKKNMIPFPCYTKQIITITLNVTFSFLFISIPLHVLSLYQTTPKSFPKITK